MAKFKFGRCSRRRRIKFFQSAPRYLNNNAATFYERGKTRKWSSEEPQSSDHKILTFANGHYGIYFSLFNHELRKKENDYCLEDKRSILVALPQIRAIQHMPEFHISKANQKIHNDINEIKSTLSAIGPQSTLKFIIPTRTFTTAAKTLYAKNTRLDTQKEYTAGASRVEQTSHASDITALEDNQDHFESSFAKTQSDLIVQTFQNHSTGSDLNVIFPLYQSLKRNDLLLPSIKEFNLVMKSIDMRSLDSEASLSAIESKLTCLLTVYEDILHACTKNRKYTPDSDTYNIVLSSMFANIDKAIKLASEPSMTHHTYHSIVQKIQEFTLVALKLMLSIKDIKVLDLDEILPNALSCINFLPSCINADVAKLISSFKDVKLDNTTFYSQMILSTANISKPELLNLTKKEAYDFISSLYSNYQESVLEGKYSRNGEFEVYRALVQGLISNGNLPVATKFLDQILLSFEDDCQNGKVQPENVRDVSSLLSRYIDTMISSGKIEDLNRALSLVSKFSKLNYLPELDVRAHSNLIKAQIHFYISQEIEKQNNAADSENIAKMQNDTYNRILEHYNFVSIRKDFQKGISTTMSNSNGILDISCREALLSLALDISDHSTISRIMKEMLLKNDIVKDWNISRKLFQYLLSGAMSCDSHYYSNVMWSFAEQQASHFKEDPVELHNYLSEHSDFLLRSNPSVSNQILNSLMVYNAVRTYSVESSNAYGIVSVMSYLFSQAAKLVDSRKVFKILQYQSLLIQELEDTDNHYVELCPQLSQFKSALASSFRELLANAPPNTPRSHDINVASSMLSGHDLGGLSDHQVLNSDFKVDLSSQLTVNYNLGIKMFLNYFKDGYSFSDETLNAVISREFVTNFLEVERPIKIRDFLLRLIPTSCLESHSHSTNHLVNLIRLGNEKVNLKILETLISSDYEFLLKEKKILESLAQFSLVTENKQYLGNLYANFSRFKSICPDKQWVLLYFKKLISCAKYSEASVLIKDDYNYFAGDLNVRVKGDAELLETVLTVLLRTGDSQLINEILKNQFSGVDGNKLLLGSEKLLSCFFEYYMSVGSFTTVVQQFSSLSHKNAYLRPKIQLARYLAHLEGNEFTIPNPKCETRDDLILSMINESNILRMRQLYESNQHLVGRKDVFFKAIVDTLNHAAAYSKDTNLFKIRAKFEAMIKLCKAINLTGLSCGTLMSVIKLLASTKSTDLLHILFNKFTNTQTISRSLNFFFLHVEIRSPKEADTLLQSFKSALIEVGDKINLAIVEQMEQFNARNET